MNSMNLLDQASVAACSTSDARSGEPVAPTLPSPSKAEVLAYEFPDLVHRIQNDLKLSPEVAHALFKDMLQFLYVCGTTRNKRHPFYPPLRVDEAWHTFLLFTREYDAFCRFYFGVFIHHSPVTPTNRDKHRDTPKDLILPIAREAFGELSENWTIQAADCPQSCCPSYEDMD